MAYESELGKFVQKFGSDCPATITMGQLQHLVNEKNAAQARIQELEALCDNYNSMCSQQDELIKELEANQVVCAAGCRERKELLESKVKIKQLEAHVERLQWCAKAAIGWIDSVPSDVVLPAMPGFDRDEFDAIIDETPAQSLKAKNWEAAEKLDQIVDSD